MVKDTVHTTEPDRKYHEGVIALSERDYTKAASILSSYRDYNAALAYASLGYNHTALEILSSLSSSGEPSPQKEKMLYLEAVLLARTGDSDKALTRYMEACRLNPGMKFRGNLDPEITALLGLVPEDEDEEDFGL